jgi:hypothetical protein
MLYIALQIQRDTSALGIIGFGPKFWSQVC